MIVSRLRAVLTRERLDRDFSDELQEHLTMLTEGYEAMGMPPTEARRAAVLKLGHPELLREQHRDYRGLPLLDVLMQDLRLAARQMRRSPGFTAVVVLTLALGIGITTAISSLVYTIIVRNLPVEEPDRLVTIQRVAAGAYGKPVGLPGATFESMSGLKSNFSDVN
jgi:hypothetical protein